MSDREAFESAVRATWSDCYPFTRDKDGEYRENKLDGMWWGWQASRQALEGEPVGWIVHCSSGYKKRPHAVLRSDYNVEAPKFWVGGKPPPDATVTRLYTHPVSAAVPEKWRTVMKELADDLESEIEARRSGDLDRRIERDLIVVKEARVLLDDQEQPQ